MAETPFATVDDLKARWPDFPAGTETYAAVMLEDASQFILDTAPHAGAASEATRRRVVCAVVRRAMLASASGMVGMTSVQEATGPFSATYQAANPNGDFFLTKQELKALGGASRPAAFGVQIAIPEAGAVNHRPWCDVTFGRACSCGAALTGGDPLWES